MFDKLEKKLEHTHTHRSVPDDFVEHTQSKSRKNATTRYIHTHTHIIYPQIAQTI